MRAYPSAGKMLCAAARSALAIFLALACYSCKLNLQTVTRDINAAWSDDDASILIAQSSYVTPRPDEPYFNATKGRNWKLTFYRAAATNLSDRVELFSFKENKNPGGLLQYYSLYWFGQKKLLVAGDQLTPYLIKVDTGQKMDLVIPPGVKPALVDFPELVDGFAIRETLPSPDGGYTAVLSTTAYIDGPTLFDPPAFNHVLSLFENISGRHLASLRIAPWPLHDDITQKSSFSLATQALQTHLLLWSSDPARPGIYVANTTTETQPAIFVPLEGQTLGTPAVTDQVPRYAAATSTGLVSDTGTAVLLTIDGNATELLFGDVAGWVPFEDVPLVGKNSVLY
jgi:hypothetical protein